MNDEQRALSAISRFKHQTTVDNLLNNSSKEDLLSIPDIPKTIKRLRLVKRSEVIVRDKGEYQCKAEKLFKSQTMYKHIRAKCNRKGIPFNLSIDYLIEIFPDECPVFKMPFHMNEHGYASMAPSVDKIVPELGYVVGNVQIISRKANMMKNDASLAELYIFAQWAEKLYLDSTDRE